MRIVEVEPGGYSLWIDGLTYEAGVEEMEGGVAVTIRGRRFEVLDPRRRIRRSQAGAEGQGKVVAPMPGRVVRVLVSAGDAVEAGQGIAVVEAMKMQNEMKAPKAGIVAALTAREGAAVSAGEVLAVIE